MRFIVLDQNVPEAIVAWMSPLLPEWTVLHVNSLGMSGAPDHSVYRWAQDHHTTIVTYDEDFADVRMRALGSHHGIVRLRVWPTTIENTQRALLRLIEKVPDRQWDESLIIIDNQKIRIRRG